MCDSAVISISLTASGRVGGNVADSFCIRHHLRDSQRGIDRRLLERAGAAGLELCFPETASRGRCNFSMCVVKITARTLSGMLRYLDCMQRSVTCAPFCERKCLSCASWPTNRMSECKLLND